MMSDDQPTQLTDQERRAMESLDRKRQPSSGLEDKVVAALKSEGLIRSSNPGSGWLKSASLLAASVAMLMVGYLIGRAGAPESISSIPSRTTDASKFMLLLYETEDDHLRSDPEKLKDKSLVKVTEEKLKEQSGEYRAWGNGLGEKGILAAGEPLKIGGRMLRPEGNGVVQAASHPVPDDLILGGYFMIYADTLEEAVKIAEESPHLRFDGTIIVRQIGFGTVTEESPVS